MECAAQDVIWIDDLGAQNSVSGYDTLAKYLETFKGQIPPHVIPNWLLNYVNNILKLLRHITSTKSLSIFNIL